MKRFIYTLVMVLGICQMAGAQKYYEKIKVKTSMDTVSYGIGLVLAQNIVDEVGIKGLNCDAIAKAFYDVISNKTPLMDKDESMAAVQSFVAAIEEEKSAEAKKKEKEYLDNNAKEPGVKVTESGLQYLVVKEGTGAKPNENSRVKLHYEGKLTNGDVFDSSYDNDEPVEFDLDYIIPGMAEGLMLMNEGSEYILYIPSELGYGSYSPDESIPAYSTLIFNVELISVSEKPAEEAVEEIELH